MNYHTNKGIRYCGGKSKCKGLIKIMNQFLSSGRTFWDAFTGSAKIVQSIRQDSERWASDTNVEMISLLKEIQNGWNPPETVDEETYQIWFNRRGIPKWEKHPMMAFCGYGCSFGGRYFQGYARDPKNNHNFANAARSALLRQKPFLKNVNLGVRDYRSGWPCAKTPDLIYL
jgi:site-specific DNA-adenine methylase